MEQRGESGAEVVIGRQYNESCWTIDVTDKSQIKRWARLTEQAGGEILVKSEHWTRFKIPAALLQFRLKRQGRPRTEVERAIATERFRKYRESRQNESGTGEVF